MFSRCWLALLVFVSSASAFFIYTPSVPETPAQKGTIGEYIIRAFGYKGPDASVDHQTGMTKLSIKRHAIPSNVSPSELAKRQSGLHKRSSKASAFGRKHGVLHERNQEQSTPTIGKRQNQYKFPTAALPAQTQSAPIDEDGTDFSYFSPVKFGDNGDVLYMLIDTGSAVTWIMGTDCRSPSCTTHNLYGNTNSGTLQITSDTFDVTYGSGAVKGVVVKDSVDLAGLKLSMSFGSASTASNDFESFPFDGILGFGRPKENIIKAPTFMEAVADAKLLPANIFGVHLQRQIDGSTDGEINFGAPNTVRYDGDLTYTNAVPDMLQWEIPVDDVIVAGTPLKLTGNTAVIDTGTSYMLLPPVAAKALHAAIPGSVVRDVETFTIPCDATAQLQVVFSQVAYTISPKDYLGKPIPGGNQCISNIIALQTGGLTQWLLGDVFLKNVYSVFDFDMARIGFGVKGGAASSSSSTNLPPSSTSGTSGPSSTIPSTSSPSGSGSITAPMPSVSALLPPTPSSSSTPSDKSQPGSTSPSAIADTTASGSPTGTTGAAPLSPNVSAAATSGAPLFWLAILLAQLCVILFLS